VDKKVLKLKKILSRIKPEHDTPVGLIHPYWARKPLNIINAIVETLSKPGDVVLDPFMGSGTIIFSALSLKRHAIGIDINPLSKFIVENILKLNVQSQEKKDDALTFKNEMFEKIYPWYKWKLKNSYVDRERYVVEGTFEQGKYSLKPYEVVIRQMNGNGHYSRIVSETKTTVLNYPDPKSFLNHPVNFKDCKLIPNSRIAVQKGENLSHFYTVKNTASINYALHLIKTNGFKNHSRDTLRFILSSSLPLLRLSDPKASSQWPYWRPKNKLTSRSPITILEKRTKAFFKLMDWAKSNLGNTKIVPINKFDSSSKLSNVSIINKSASDVLNKKFTKVELLLTDPPYSDQVPYLEYSLLWVKVLGLRINENIWKKEIVKTDAPSRKNDTSDYSVRLEKAFKGCCDVIKKNGYLVWFYQDRELKNWSILGKVAKKNGFELMDILPINKQRRSMKTVTSAGSTFDGDLILIFKNTGEENSEFKKYFGIKEIEENVLKAIDNHSNLFEKYASLIKCGLKDGWLEELGDRKTDVVHFIKSLEKSDE